jgi:hypothetical protein
MSFHTTRFSEQHRLLNGQSLMDAVMDLLWSLAQASTSERNGELLFATSCPKGAG